MEINQLFYAVFSDSLFVFVTDREVRDNLETRRYPENRGAIDPGTLCRH